jgi:hypothetical protein
MLTDLKLVLIGSLLVLVGAMYLAFQPIWRSRMSQRRRLRSGLPADTLEPVRPASGFDIRSNWPGVALVALGLALLMGSAVPWI